MPAKVLIVEGNEDARKTLHDLLSDAGYETATAASFPDGLLALQWEEPDVLVADVQLGAFNGLQFVATSRRRLPTLILSGFHDPGLLEEARQLGAAYLEKPVEASTLLDAVGKLAGDSWPGNRRRSQRRLVVGSIPARVDGQPARLVDVSHGGLCVELEVPVEDIPAHFDLSLPDSRLSLRVDVVWKVYRTGGSWLCGAAVSQASETEREKWKGVVATIS